MNRKNSDQKENIAAAMRAIARDKSMQIDFGGNNNLQAQMRQNMVRLPSLPEQHNEAELRLLRGVGDAAALRIRLHDENSFARFAPTDSKALAVYEAMEQARVEAIGSRDYAGIANNIALRTEMRCMAENYSSSSEPLAEIMALMLKKMVSGQSEPEIMKDIVSKWRPWVMKNAGEHFQQLADKVDSPAEFSRILAKTLAALGFSIPEQLEPSEQTGEDSQNEQPNQSGATSEQKQSDKRKSKDERDQTQISGDEKPLPEKWQEIDSDAESDEYGEFYIPNLQLPDGNFISSNYRVFTTSHDETINASALIDPNELKILRSKLDDKLGNYASLTSRLANRLLRLLMARQRRRWLFDQEEGLIDSGKLSRLIISPDYSFYYKQESESDFRDTVVTLLLDNSGSMRGRPIMVAALSSDILARTLERCGVKVEILGFTTRDWKGGKSRKQWSEQGGIIPEGGPGRLNDLRHIIYKTADTPWRRARNNLGLMLKDGILKENIDGEAVLWAHQRLMYRKEQRRILMVISDGAPVDDSTLSVNHSGYLDSHLREVIKNIEQRSPVEIMAIGIGHDVTRYYKRAITISDVDKLGDTMLAQLSDLFTEPIAATIAT